MSAMIPVQADNASCLTDFEQYMLEEYEKGNLNDTSFVQARKQKATENNLLDYCDENYFLNEDFYYEFSFSYLMNNGLIILDRYTLGLATFDTTLMTRSAYFVIDQSIHKYTDSNGYYITNGIWRLSNNNLAFCAQGLMASPSIGDSTSAPYLVNNDNLKKCLYYGYGGPGDILTSRYGTSGAIVLTDELVSNAYSGTCIGKAQYNAYHWNQTVSGLWNEIMSKSLPFGYDVYMVDVDGTASNWQGVTTSKQKLVYGVYAPKGSVKLYKSSSLPQVSSNNKLYSLSDTKYGLYMDSSCSVLKGTFTLNENGESNTISDLSLGTYYVKEMDVKSSYVKDTNVYTIQVNENACTKLNVSDVAKTNILDLVLLKQDSSTGQKAQGQATLEGAEFSFKYYDGYYDEISDDLKPLRQWIMKTDSNGQIYFDENHKVSGDDFYYDADGKIVLPVGTITAQEIKAPSGYKLNSKVYIQKLTSNSQEAHFTSMKVFNVSNDVITLKIKKVQVGTDIPLTGVMFYHTDPNGNTRRMRTTNGYLTFIGPSVGIHTFYEYKTLDGYMLSDKKYQFEVKEDGSIVSDDNLEVIENEVKPYTLKLVKKNESDSLLDGALFGIYSDAQCTQLIESKTTENGIVEFNNLKNLERYYFKEISAPKGYELDETIHEVYCDLIPVNKQYDVYLDNEKQNDSLNDFIVTYDVTNKKTTKLPHTGSSLTLIMFVVGIVCMIFRRRVNEK